MATPLPASPAQTPVPWRETVENGSKTRLFNMSSDGQSEPVLVHLDPPKVAKAPTLRMNWGGNAIVQKPIRICLCIARRGPVSACPASHIRRIVYTRRTERRCTRARAQGHPGALPPGPTRNARRCQRAASEICHLALLPPFMACLQMRLLQVLSSQLSSLFSGSRWSLVLTSRQTWKSESSADGALVVLFPARSPQKVHRNMKSAGPGLQLRAIVEPCGMVQRVQMREH